jgi:hypothetical protein
MEKPNIVEEKKEITIEKKKKKRFDSIKKSTHIDSQTEQDM